MVILHFNKVRSVYRPFVVTTKLSSICVDEKEEEEEEKTDRTRCCNSWHHTQAERRRHARQASKKKGSVYVIEDTTRRRERERGKAKKYMNGIRCLRRWKRFDYDEFSILPFLLCLFPCVHDCITFNTPEETKEKRKREKMYIQYLEVFKQLSVLFLSSMFVYSS
jgi:hypothetical protein